MNFRGTIIGGVGVFLMAWPAFGQVMQQPYSWASSPDMRYPGPAFVSPAAYTLASEGAPAAPAAAAPMGGDCACNSCASGCCATPCCCCANMWDHETGIFAEYLYLRPFGADVAHGIQQNGVGGLGTVPAGDVGIVTPEFNSGYRVGFEYALCCSAGIRATYTDYATHSDAALLAAPGIGGTAASLLLHPGTVSAASTFSQLDAAYGIDFRLADIDYSVLLTECDNRAVNFDIGVRYAHLRQDFEQVGIFTGALGQEDTTTNIHFDGVGLRAGFDGAWRLGNTRIAAYGQGFMNVVFGEFSSRYQQFNTTTSTIEAASNWSDDRVVPILDYEVGLRWTSCNGHWQASTGYYTAFWFNTVATPDFVRAVQNADFTHVDRTITFTGFTTRLEYRF